MNNNKVYFLDDEPKKDLQEDDAFGHIYYARTLYEILEKIKTTKSYAIGLFGILGVGKTSIINELHRLIKGGTGKKELQSTHNYKILKLDAWEYSEQNFRREFLLDLGEQFDCRKEIRDKLITKRIIETKEAPKHDCEWFKKLIKEIGFFLLVWAIPFFLLINMGGSFSQSVLCSTILVFFVSVATIFRDNIKDLFTFQTTIQETEPAVYPDQFKEIFKLLIQEKAGISKENDRLIIVLDNLDRVKEEIVIQILGAVKTFLKEDKCIYILPCDDKGLKQHIISTRSGTGSPECMTETQANDYLRKFFQSTLIIRTLLTEDLDSFTDKVLDKLIIFDLPIYEHEEGKEEKQKKDKEIRKRNRDEVALVFRVAIAKSPRRIIQLANKLSTNYLLVQERGKENYELRINILSNLGFLAKVNVIEEEWPEFYSLIVEYPDILRQLYNYFITEDETYMPNLRQRLKDWIDQNMDEWKCGLEDFLHQTNPIYSDYVSDFLLFKQKPTIRSIADYHKFHDAALSRQAEIVESVVKNENTNIEVAFKELLDELGTQSRNKNIPSSTSLMYCILKIFYLIPVERTQLQQRVANKVSETLSSKLFVDAALDVGLSELLSLLDHSERKWNKEQIIDNIVNGIKFKEELENTLFILYQLVDHYTLLTKKNRLNLRVKLTEPGQDKDLLEDFRKFANKCLAIDKELAQALIPQEFYKQNIALLQSPGVSANDALNFLKNFFSLFESNITEEYVDAILQHFKQLENTMTPQKELALSLIASAPPELIPESKRKLISERLVTYYNQLPDMKHKNQVTKIFFHLLPVLKLEEQQLYHPCFINTIDNSNPDLLLEIIKVVQEQKKNLYEPDMIMEKIRNRVQAHIANDDLRKAFYELANVTESRDYIQELIISVWPQQDHALNALDNVKSVLRSKEFRSLVFTLIEKSSSLPVNQYERALEALGKHHDMYTKPFLHTLTEILLNDWFKKTSIEARRGAKMFWQGIREKAEKERGRFHERLLEYCKQSINDDTIIEEPQKVYVETLLEDYEYLSAKSRSQLVSLCLRMIEAAKSQPIKNYGHNILRKLSKDQFAQKHVPEELLSDLEQDQNDQDIRNSFETLLQYKDYLIEPMSELLEKIFKNIKNDAIIQEFKEKFK